MGLLDFIEGEIIRQIHSDGTVAFGTCLVKPFNVVQVGDLVLRQQIDAVARITGVFQSFVPIEGLTSGSKLLFPLFGPGGLLRAHEFHLPVNILEMRAYMLIGVPYTNLGDFGCHYDPGTYSGFYDLTGSTSFYDGYALGTANLQKSIYNAVKDVKAAGVGFDLYREHDLGPYYTGGGPPIGPPPPSDDT